jgi:hypothetical protein
MGEAESHERDVLALRIGAATGAAATGLGASLLVGPRSGAMAAAVAGPLLDQLVDLVAGVRHRQAVAMVQAAVEAADRSVEEFLERITNDPQRLQLFSAAATAAAATAHWAKIQAIGRALAAGVLADSAAAVDEQRILIDRLAGLEELHFQALVVASGDHPSTKERRRDGQPHGRGWVPEELLPNSQIAWAIVSDLESRGLLTDVTRGLSPGEIEANHDYRKRSYIASNTGRRVLELLRDESHGGLTDNASPTDG